MTKIKRYWIPALFLSIVIVVAGSYLYQHENKKVELTFGMFAGSQWNVPNDDYYKIIDETIEEFEKKYPDVKVTYTSGILEEDYSEWISNQALSGDTPDVMMVLPEDLATFSSTGLLRNLDDLIESDVSFRAKDYYQSAYETGTYQGDQYALPYESVPTMMFVNKDLLKKEGIPLPKDDWTWEDFYRICKKVTKDINHDGLMDQFGVYNYTWREAVVTNGCQLFNAKGTKCNLTDSTVKEAITFAHRIHEANGNKNATSKDFDKGNVVFRPMTFAEYKTYKPYPWRLKKYANFDWDCIKLPAGPQGNNVSTVESLVMGISNDTKHKVEAWNFLKMLTYNEKTQSKILKNEQGVSALKKVTTSKQSAYVLQHDISQDVNLKMDFLDEIMEQAKVATKFKGYNSIRDDLDKNFEYIINSGGDIDNQLLILKKEIDQKLSKKGI